MADTALVETRRVNGDALRSFTQASLEAVGFKTENARVFADIVVESDLRGVDTHGVTRLAGYINLVKKGMLNPTPDFKVVRDEGATALFDAGGGAGHVYAHRAMVLAIDKARQYGIGSVGVGNSTHNGMNAYYPLMAIEAGMIGFVFTQGPAIVPPFGSKTPALATNPLSIGAPADRHQYVLMDMATTVVAGGKLRLAQKKGIKIPTHWAMDQEGQPTDDPTRALDGFLQWAGGYKGYALAVMIEVLGGVLTGGLFGRQVPRMREFGQDPLVSSHLLIALDIARFMPVDEFKRRLDELVDDLHSVESIAGVERIYVPGEPERDFRADREKNGIPLSLAVYNELVRLGESLDLSQKI